MAVSKQARGVIRQGCAIRRMLDYGLSSSDHAVLARAVESVALA